MPYNKMEADYHVRAPWKRSACDRCRSQKLRCHRDDGNLSGECNRCNKSGSNCVTSMTRPTGRPPSRPPTFDDSNHVPTNSEMNVTSLADDSVEDQALSSTVNLEFDLSLGSVLGTIDMQQMHSTLSDDLDDIYDMDDLCSFSHQSTSLQSSPSATEVPQQIRGDSSTSLSPYTRPLYQFPNCLLVPGVGIADPELLAPKAGSVEIPLSQLHLELCNHLSYIQSASWDVQDALRLTMSQERNESCDGKISKKNPLGPVAQASKELERLLTNLRPSLGIADISLAFSDHSCPAPLHMTHFLVALSCYIQIISIYDCIFTTVVEHLSNASFSMSLTSVSSSHGQTATRMLYLGGLPILPTWKICGALLVHEIEYQLEQIDTLLGLPEHYRVSARPRDDGKDMVTGLFAGQQSQSFLTTVFQLAEHTRCVRSLRSKMRQVKDL